MKSSKIVTILFVIVALLLTTKAAFGAVYINEIVANPQGADSGEEWVELYSDTNEAINLSNWYFSDSNDKGNLLPGTLGPDNRYVTFSDTAIGFTLLNSGETLELYNSLDELQDSVTYIQVTEGNSYARVDDASADWEEKEEPTKEAANSEPSPLEINEDSVEITINDVAYSLDEELNVSANDLINVEFDYQNNMDGVIGYVLVTAESDQTPDFVDYESEDWALLPKYLPTSDSFDFSVPASASGDFKVVVQVEDEDIEGNVFSDSFELDFHLLVGAQSVTLEYADLDDNTLTCSKITNLRVGIGNTGAFEYAPDIRIFNEEATIVAGTDELEFSFETPVTFSKEVQSDAGKIPVGEGEEIITSINVSELDGPQTLYVYLVSPFFYNAEEGSFYFGDSTTVEVEDISECLNTEAIEEELKSIKFSQEEKHVDFFETDGEGEYVFIYEDMDYESTLTFEIPEEGQSNEDLIVCQMTNLNTEMFCNYQGLNAGSSDVIVAIKEDHFSSYIEEEIEVVIEETIAISSVKVNGVSVQKEEESQELFPLEEIEITLTVTNMLDHWVTGVRAEMFTDLFNSEESDIINLNSDESKTLTITGQIPADATAGNYPATLIVYGEDFENNEETQGDIFYFELVINQEVADLKISDLTLENENVTCKANTGLMVELTNTGSNDEDDVIITVKTNDLEISTEEFGPLTVFKNGGQEFIAFEIPSSNLTEGDNQVLVELSYRNGLKKDLDSVTINKKSCIASWLPEEDTFVMSLDTDELSVTLTEEEYNNEVEWYVNDELTGTGNEFSFSPDSVGDFEVYATIGGENSHTWVYYITDVPLSPSGLVPEDYFEGKDTSAIEDFTVGNSNGQIVFNEVVDLSGILDLDEVIKIENGIVGVDGALNGAPELNVPATITLNKDFVNHRILRAEGFGDSVGEFVLCPEAICKAVSNVNGKFIFTVTGFSTYKVVEEQNADLSISNILIENINRGENGSTQITIKNLGTFDELTNFNVNLVGINSKYNAKIDGIVPNTLKAEEQLVLTLSLSIPEDESSGKQSIGKLRLNSSQVEKEVDIYINPKSHLKIDSIKINGKSSGDLSIEETNEIEVKVQNDYSEDINDVLVTVKILDVDGDDLEEEANEEDIRDGNDETFDVEFDLGGEKIDEDSYTIEITVEGEADDGSKHEIVETKTVDVDIENHKVIIDKTSLSSSTVQCLRQTTLKVDVENIGKKDEDDVVVKVRNTALNLDLSKANINLDKFSDSDNDYSANFNLNLEDVDAGTYPITVEVYRNDDVLEDSTEVMVEIKDCYTTNTASQTADSFVDKDQLALQLKQQLDAKKTAGMESKVKQSFRESNTYTTLLSVLVALVFIALMLVFALAMKKKK
jgi:hypothetical protein